MYVTIRGGDSYQKVCVCVCGGGGGGLIAQLHAAKGSIYVVPISPHEARKHFSLSFFSYQDGLSCFAMQVRDAGPQETRGHSYKVISWDSIKYNHPACCLGGGGGSAPQAPLPPLYLRPWLC